MIYRKLKINGHNRRVNPELIPKMHGHGNMSISKRGHGHTNFFYFLKHLCIFPSGIWSRRGEGDTSISKK